MWTPIVIQERPASPPGRPRDPADRQDVGHTGDQTPDFGQDYGHEPELEEVEHHRPPPPAAPGTVDRPAAMGASSGELWTYSA